MTRSFLKRAAVAAVLLAFGIVFVWGDKSLFDRLISNCSTAQVSIVLGVLVTFWIALGLWVVVRLQPTKWAQREASGHGRTTAVLAVISAAVLSAQPAQGWVMVAKEAPTTKPVTVQTVEIQQPFTLSPDVQRQVDAAIVEASEGAKANPNFVVTVEAAIGIFIAAVVIGAVLVIVVRMVCKSLDKMKQTINSRLTRLKELLDPAQTNTAPIVLGTALFNHRPATIDDLSIGEELRVGFTASGHEKPIVLKASIGSGETVEFDEFVNDFGLTDKLPLDSVVGTGVAREGDGFKVAEGDVALSIESCSDIARGVWKSVLSLRVPAGAVLDFADLTGNSENRYWRVGVAQ